ncbi:MAG: hypothetical protein HPY65_09960 [Syntrophaceae bacterium]|nr:hypothetical protein [Syntrophaceae bacterium]
MKKRLFIVFGIVLLVAYLFANAAAAEAQRAVKVKEKQIILKGLSIGMDINEARKICVNLIGKNWTVSQVEDSNALMSHDREFFKKNKMRMFGKQGFLMKNKDGNLTGYGFIIDDDGNGKVTEIFLSGELTDYIFLTNDVHADYFVEEFKKNFGLPNLPWIFRGWQYSSPLGYELTIMTDKSIDLKRNKPNIPRRPKIKFD